MKTILTKQDIEAGKTPAGGFNKRQLAEWGISWPPKKGWKKRLMNGGEGEPRTEPEPAYHALMQIMELLKQTENLTDVELGRRIDRVYTIAKEALRVSAFSKRGGK